MDRERAVNLLIMLLVKAQGDDIDAKGNMSRISKTTKESTCGDLQGKTPSYSLEKGMKCQLVN